MFFDGFQSLDDVLEIRGDLAVVGGQAAVTSAFGEAHEFEGVVALTDVQRQKLGRCLEVRAGQTCVRVWTVLLGRPAAVPVRPKLRRVWVLF